MVKRYYIARRILLYLLLAFLFSAVLFSDFLPSFLRGYDVQRVLLTVVLVAALSFNIFWLSDRRFIELLPKRVWPFLFLIITFLLPTVQYRFGLHYLVEPVFYALYFLSFSITGYVIRIEGGTREVAQALVAVAGVSCFFYAAMSITVYLFAITDNFSQLDKIIPWGFVNIRYWSHIATWMVPLFPLCLLAVSWRENRLWRLGVAFTAAIWWWILLMSSSRGSMVGLFAGLILVWLFFGRAALPWIRLFARFIAYGLIIWVLLSVVIPSLVFDEIHVRGVSGDSSGRMPLWREAWTMSLQNFPFGMGPQSWLTHELLTDAYQVSPKFGHPHNMYLMWAAEYGWISIAAFVLLCGVAFRNLWSRIVDIREEKGQNVLYLVAFTASVTAALFHAGVSAVFIAPGSMLIGLCVLSVFWALIKPEVVSNETGARVGNSPRSRYAGYALVLVFLVAGAFWFLEVLRYREAMADDLEYYQNELSLSYLPRFWFHGNFPRHPSQMPDK